MENKNKKENSCSRSRVVLGDAQVSSFRGSCSGTDISVAEYKHVTRDIKLSAMDQPAQPKKSSSAVLRRDLDLLFDLPMSSGIYYVRLQSGAYYEKIKMMLLRDS